MPAGAIAAGMFGCGGHGPDCISAKATLSDIGASLAKLCWTSSISVDVICLFIFFSFPRFDFGATGERAEQDQVVYEIHGKVRFILRSFALSTWRANAIATCAAIGLSVRRTVASAT
jgi:hypothetical protein